MFRFGWPLLVNGILLFCIMQGDRVILGAQTLFPGYTKTQLASFAIALAVTTAPNALVASVIFRLWLPHLARAQDDPPLFQRRFARVVRITVAVGTVVFVLFTAFGSKAVTVIYGGKYADVGPLLGWLAAAQSIRLLRVGPNTAALAKGDSGNVLVGNVGRAVGVGLAVAAAIHHMTLNWIAIAALIGESIALVASYAAIYWRQQSPSVLSVHRPDLAS